MSPQPATHMVEVDDGTRLRTWTAGTRTALPPVVLLHGGPGMWDYADTADAVLVRPWHR